MCSNKSAAPRRAMLILALIFLAIHILPACSESARTDLLFGLDDTTLLKNNTVYSFYKLADVNLLLTCLARYPTEWVANFDPARGGVLRDEWTERKQVGLSQPWCACEQILNCRIDTGTAFLQCEFVHAQFWLYYARIHIRHSIPRQELVCRSVANHSENILVKFERLVSVSQNDQSKVEIIWTRSVPVTETLPSTKSCNAPPNPQFKMTQQNGRYYFRCRSGSILIYNCPTAAYCANTLRHIKALPASVTVRKYQVITDQWDAISTFNGAGVVSCNSTFDPCSPAIEFFFENEVVSQSSQSSGSVQRKIYFSQSNISMKDLIWMDPVPKEVYYTREILESHCYVPNYGFSLDPWIVITMNGSTLLSEQGYAQGKRNVEPIWSKKVKLDFTLLGPGSYKIQCIGPVWNTTDLANQTKTIQVKNVISPHFESKLDTVDITFKDGDINQNLICDVAGDPRPVCTWNYPDNLGFQVKGKVLTFVRIFAWNDGLIISCTATNQFGESVTKIFHINVAKGQRVGNEGSPSERIVNVNGGGSESYVLTSTIMPIVAIVVGICIVAGLAFIYFKFRKMGEAFTSLSAEEEKEFREGKPLPSAKENKMRTPDTETLKPVPSLNEEDQQPIAIDFLAYNSEFEVAKANLFVDTNVVLGSGEYGVVYKGHIKVNARDQNPIPVAVKTVRKNVHVNYFRALMSELKILAYIGHSEHIGNLIGACSSEIRNRELYVGVELCKTSLLLFLRDNRHNFINCMHPNSGHLKDQQASLRHYQNKEFVEAKMTTFDLIRWSTEIASGMEFLSQKRVVHGDLAGRNVLLTFDLHAKICDFGLARQLIDYNYIKSQSCPLPWKWMAIESLTEMKSSTKSDVWAYGVTLWEIFSLGKAPYPGMVWSMEFVERLIEGLRLLKPMYANDLIFKKMVECWHELPKERPNFTDLKLFFQSLESNQK